VRVENWGRDKIAVLPLPFGLVRRLTLRRDVQMQTCSRRDVFAVETTFRAFALTLREAAARANEEVDYVLRAGFAVRHSVLPEDGRSLHEQTARFRSGNSFAQLVGAF
jgi:hypothetical protein